MPIHEPRKYKLRPVEQVLSFHYTKQEMMADRFLMKKKSLTLIFVCYFNELEIGAHIDQVLSIIFYVCFIW